MIPIISHGKSGDNGYTFDHFEEEFLNICETHRQEKRALAFAFILYDFLQPQIAKTLHDQDYWNALDKLSGQYLSVFSFHTISNPKRKRPKKEENGSQVLYQMANVYSEEFNDGRSLLEKHFNLEDNIRLPAILFFQVSNSEIIDSHLVQLTENKKEDAFLEIKEIISTAAESVSEVKEENHRNDHVIFNLIENSLKERGVILLVKNTIKKVIPIKEILSLFG